MPVVRRAVLTAGGALTALALVAGCGSSGNSAAPSAAPSSSAAASGGTLTVVATTNVWGAVAKAVAGPDADVKAIISDPAGDPHSYESTPADAAAITSSDITIANGGGYDEFAEKIADADPAAKAKMITAFDLRPDKADDNEHVWFDPTTVKAVANQIAQRLAQAEPTEAAGLTQRAQAFDARVDQIAQQTAAIGASRPGTRVISTEPIAHYLLRTAGVADVTPQDFVEAIENETDPSAASLVEVRNALTAKQVTALVFNPQTETPVVAGLRDTANAAQVPVVEVTETLPAGVTDYLQWVDSTRTALARAVGAPA
ncbi:zinc ABC transporter substrate-binding protein [Actinomycetospora sp. NBRC 106378]|uniref:metal ABC transporter solute-binding protein, Zn/Mn family n=1 Tax=Actinomycetospora sp. NBRC 106378 TaxID=3032208 RepID=UPI0024A3D039|nr:zinc ABC transporter substrate-binding protein [Actinomycetospora sp. NBRC 106378]GLZ56405.1 metal ABC transporter substrate-binding protein [Actinomycetospora sp. NBRC 106378]